MRFRRFAALVLLLSACGKGHDAADAGDAGPIVDGPADVVDLDAQAAAERAQRIEQARTDLDAGTWKGPELYASSIRTSVMNVPAWPPDADAGVAPSPDVYRLGYLRHGSHVPVFPERIVNDACPDGWFELLDGGFVCGKYASLDPKDPAVKFAANPPNLAASMPYRYGFSLGNDTPVYRRVLAHADRLKYEPWLAPPPPASDAEDAGVADDPEDAGAPKEPKDAGIVKLGDLKGRGVLARKMMKGFYVALDRDFRAAKARWWRTAEGFAVPYERLMLQGWKPSFHGSWVLTADAAPRDGGVGSEADGGETAGNGTAALVKTDYAVRYRKNDKDKLAYYGLPLPKWTALELAGEPETDGGVAYQATTAGFWVRLADLLLAHPEPPSDLADGEKWIDVDLKQQMLVAFEGKRPVYATRVSSGRDVPWDPEHNRPTPTGTFRIYEKHVSVTMDGDVASDGPYSIEDVPWVMYFQGSYALHGAFWHNLFGTTRSHGCVNLSPTDAHELFFWTEPRLPTGWHGVFQTATHAGTRVVIHEPPQPKK
ncbi:MAG TPA: L,D-transpeptidase [Polyangiaceae bacterium]|nr:L,D-transpeptidase [Polyangiaceae bacterium]